LIPLSGFPGVGLTEPPAVDFYTVALLLNKR
jgi:hypothetical protein